MCWLALVTAIMQTVAPPAPSEDSIQLIRRQARRAEMEYESLLRRLAPATVGSGGSGQCDEVVGRFCLRFSAGPEPPILPEVGRVTRARWEAVDALRRAFALQPGELSTAAPLVRYLVEGDRAPEAISAAEAFAWASGDPVWGPAVMAFAYHANGQDSTAERHFASALAAMDEQTRERFTWVEALLDNDESRLYRSLKGAEREAYEAVLWRAADPLYLTAENEAWVEHLARGVWVWMLSRAPVVSGMYRWGKDLEELTLRYGPPAGRKREVGMNLGELRMIEQFDPEQLPFVPPELRRQGLPAAPLPGEPSPLEATRVRSAHMPRTVRRVIPITHQASRFPRGDSILVRLDGALVLDSVARDVREQAGRNVPRLTTGLFVLDADFHKLAEVRGEIRAHRDTILVSHALMVDRNVRNYSLEVIEGVTRLAGRARHPIDPDLPSSGGLALSDLLVAHPFGEGRRPTGPLSPELHALPELVLPTGAEIGLYAEVHGLEADESGTTAYRVTLSVQAPDGPALARAARWLGRRLGLAGPGYEPELSWEATGDGIGPEIIAIDLDLTGLRPGLHWIELVVADLVAGTEVQTSRPILIRDAGH